MKNFNFYCLLLSAGVFFVYGQKDSPENENELKDPNDKTKNVSDSKSSEKEVKKYYQRGFLIAPDEKPLFNQKLFQGLKPGFLEADDYMPHLRIFIGDKRQNLHLTDNSGRYNAQMENFQKERPTYFQAARTVNQKNQEYIPYPSNGDPYNYPAYGGPPQATEPPVIKAYVRSSSSNVAPLSLVDIGQQNLARVLASNIYQRSFPEFRNFGRDLYSGHFFNNGPNQVRSAEGMNKWHEDYTNEYTPVERLF